MLVLSHIKKEKKTFHQSSDFGILVKKGYRYVLYCTNTTTVLTVLYTFVGDVYSMLHAQ